MKHTGIDELADALGRDELLLDVREPGEYEQVHVPGARLVPLAHVASAAPELPTDRPVHVICASGNRSQVAVEVLVSQGVDARNVEGGTRAWLESGREYATGRD